MDHLCYLCFVFVMLSRLFIAALWSPAGKGWPLGSRLWCLIVFLSLSHVACQTLFVLNWPFRCKMGNFSCIIVVCWLFSKLTFFQKLLSRTQSEYQTVWVQIRTDVLLVLTRVQTVCEGYQQRTENYGTIWTANAKKNEMFSVSTVSIETTTGTFLINYFISIP